VDGDAAGDERHAGERGRGPDLAEDRMSGSPRQNRYTVPVTPGELLREARRRHGVTQEQLAARARTSQAAISRIERDVVSPSVSTLATLLDLLGEELELSACPIDYGHDPTLLQRTLAMSVGERIQHGTDFANFVLRNRGVANRSA